MNPTPNEVRAILKRCMSHEVTWQEVDRLKNYIASLEAEARPAAPLHCPGCDGDHS